MNAILGMTELALDTPLTEDQRQCLKTVKSAADNLLGIINDLLDFAKIEAGKMELDPADFSLRAVVGDTLRALAMRAHQKGLEVACHIRPDVPDALFGDAGRLRQVLLNLVGNAIKFTDSGEVEVVTVRATGGHRTENRGRSGRLFCPLSSVRCRLCTLRSATPASASRRTSSSRSSGPSSRRTPRPPDGTAAPAWADHRRPAGGPHGRDDHRGERAGPGQHLHLHRPLRPPAAPTTAGHPANGPAGPAAGAGRGRQRHQPPHPGRVAARLADGADRRRRRRRGVRRPPRRRRGRPAVRRWCCSTPGCPTRTALPSPPKFAAVPSSATPESSC